jgi:hypothetical protein
MDLKEKHVFQTPIVEYRSAGALKYVQVRPIRLGDPGRHFHHRVAPLKDETLWRPDLEALVFPVRDHAAACAVHRGAFRTLLGFDPAPNDCLAFFRDHERAFEAAAGLKIARKRIPAGRNLHLTSRDIARKLLERDQIERGEQQ